MTFAEGSEHYRESSDRPPTSERIEYRCYKSSNVAGNLRVMHVGMVTRALVGARGATAMIDGRNSLVLIAVALIMAGLLLR